MNKSLFTIFFLLTMTISSNAADYFQQDIHYNIKAELDPETARIAGIESIVYKNNSPDSLSEIYFHLFYNAFQPDSYLAKRETEEGYHRTQELSDKRKGYCEIDLLKIGEIEIDNYVIDNTLMKVPLISPLAPGDSIEFYIEFTSQVHASGGRSGHKGKHFDVGQWYPKPVVYDKYGWHLHQHIDYEFYSDYGVFDVEITIPSDYIIAHVGKLLNEEEIFGSLLPMPEGDSILIDVVSMIDLDTSSVDSSDTTSIENDLSVNDDPDLNLVRDDSDTLAVSDEADLKTWRILAENVHDFAFCADPGFIIDLSRYNETIIKTYYMKRGKDKWQGKAVDYTRKAIKLFSETFYPYPYSQYSTVMTTVTSGGIEYPQLTMLNSRSNKADDIRLSFQSLVAHEVAHAWFYGILGFNETEEAFLDEGLTSFATTYFLEHYYGRRDNNYIYKKDWQKKWLPNGDERNDEAKTYFRRALMRNEDPMATPSGLFEPGRYYVASYNKASSVYYQLKFVMGDEAFFKFINALFEEWSFKHPYFVDFIELAEEFHRERLDWFFRQWFTTTKRLDFKLAGFKSNHATVNGEQGYLADISIERVEGCIAPLDIELTFKDGSKDVVMIPVDVWFDGRSHYDTTAFFVSQPKSAIINPGAELLDINPLNNKKGLPPFKQQFMIPTFIYPSNYLELYIDKYAVAHNPVIWYNDIDGLKPGYRIDGSYLGLSDMFAITGDVGLNNENFDYGVKLMDRLYSVNPNLTYYLFSKELEGRGRHGAGLNYNKSNRRAREYVDIDFSLNRNYQFESDYLNRQSWEAVDISTIDISIDKKTSRRRSSINYMIDAISSISGGGFNFTRLLGRLNYNVTGYWGYDLKVSIMGGYADGRLPYERRFRLSTADPYEMWNSPLFRSRGTLPNQWRDEGHLFKPGGAGLFGYSDIDLTGSRILSAKIERELPNLSLPFRIPFISSELARIHPDIYIASGIVWDYEDDFSEDNILSEAGFVFSYQIPYLNRFISESKLRLYLPLWMSSPIAADDNLELRWLFTFSQ